MEKQFADIYSKLVNKIISMIPVKWNKLYYLGEVENNKSSWSSVFYFESTDDNEIVKSHSIPEKYVVSEEIYEDLLNEVNDLLLELYECFQKNGQELWHQVSLSLDNTGKFNIDYLYDIINDDDGGQVKRELVWAYKTFGFMAKEGSYSRKIIDEYISDKQ
nr:immunity protein YezG family protein [uncultured Clostridium sp.]